MSEAREAIRQVKARYFRGVDTGDGTLVRSILAEDCVLDYTRCFVDPATGTDYFPALGIVLRGRDAWSDVGLAARGITSVHQGHTCDIELTGKATAKAIWSMSDRLFMPAGAPFSLLQGWGHYHETYECTDGVWLLKTLKLSRIGWRRSPPNCRPDCSRRPPRRRRPTGQGSRAARLRSRLRGPTRCRPRPWRVRGR